MPSRLRCANYNECAELIYPENPEAGSSKMRCLCDGCYGYVYPRDEPETVDIYSHYPHTHQYTKKVSGKLFTKVEDLDGNVKNLRKAINEHIDASKRKRKPLKEFD